MAIASQSNIVFGATPSSRGKQLPEADTDNNVEYNFVENPPSREYFCSVTSELLIEPFQTTCCGHHLSRGTAQNLQCNSKPCPICKHPQLNTVEDKYMKRKVSELRVRCPYGCGWEGEVKNHTTHVRSCVKRPWKCSYCDYSSTYEDGPNKHVLNCDKYPVICPNTCETFTIPRSQLQAHLTVCPLQLVSCEYAGVGCSKKIPRKDLSRHVKESQEQHLRIATNTIKLAQESLAERDRTLLARDELILENDRIIAGKDKAISEKDQMIAMKDKRIADLEELLTQCKTCN